jgi:hypothetical protein
VKSLPFFRYRPVLTLWNARGTVVGEVVDVVNKSFGICADLATVRLVIGLK